MAKPCARATRTTHCRQGSCDFAGARRELPWEVSVYDDLQGEYKANFGGGVSCGIRHP